MISCVVGDDKHDNKCNKEFLEGNFRMVGDDKCNNECNREAQEGNFCIVGDNERNNERNRPVNLVDGAPHK